MTADELRSSAFHVNEWCRNYGDGTEHFGLCLAIGAASEQLINAAAEIVERLDALTKALADSDGRSQGGE